MQDRSLIQQLQSQLQDYNTIVDEMISTAAQADKLFLTTANAAQRALDEAQAQATTERDAALQAASVAYQQALNIEATTLQNEQKALSNEQEALPAVKIIKDTIQQQLTSARDSLRKRNWSNEALLALVEKGVYTDQLDNRIAFNIQKTPQDVQAIINVINTNESKKRGLVVHGFGFLVMAVGLWLIMYIFAAFLLKVDRDLAFTVSAVMGIIFSFGIIRNDVYVDLSVSRKEKEQIERAYQSLIHISTQVEQHYKFEIARIQAEMARIKVVYDQNTAILAETRDRAIATAHATFTAAMTAAQTIYQRQKKKCDADNLRQLEALSRQSATYDEQWKATTATLIEQLETYHPVWSSSAWQTWQPATTTTTILRAGTLRWTSHSTHYTPQAFRQHPLPFVVPFPGDHALLFKVDTSTKAPVAAAIQSLMLRLVATNPPGKLRFTFIDPIGLGQNVAAFMHLADHSNLLVSGKTWSEQRDIEQQLAKLTEHMENVIQKYLRNDYHSLLEYNQKAGEIAEPFRVLVVFDFPVNFSDASARRLVSIAQNGPRCGVVPIILFDKTKPMPYGFTITDLEQYATSISHDHRGYVINNHDYRHVTLELESPPKSQDALIKTILQSVGTQAVAANNVQVPFSRIIPTTLWSKEATVLDNLCVPIGPTGTRDPQSLKLGEGTAHHALIVGKTGSGKSTLLHALITNLALTYSPEELELYLLDFKKGVEFKTYAIHNLPHARVIAIESEREFGNSVMEGLLTEMRRRGDVFRDAASNSLKAYREKTEKPMSRILLLVDEYHNFFIESDALSSRAYQILELLVREGRSVGIHIILASQTMTGAANLPEAIKSSIGVRIALQCSEADSRMILADDNPAARLLSRPGEAIHNAANGLAEGNNSFQVAWISDNDRDMYLQQIRDLAIKRQWHREPIVFEGNQPALLTKNTALQAELTKHTTASIPRRLTAWLGEPIAMRESVSVVFSRQSGRNLLIVGTDEPAALGLLTATIISLTAQLAPGGNAALPTFSILDYSTDTDEESDHFTHLADTLPISIKVGRSRRHLATILNDLATTIQHRIDTDQTRAAPHFLIIHGIHRSSDLRADTPWENPLRASSSVGASLAALDASSDEFGFTNSFAANEGASARNTNAHVPNPAAQLALILRNGPEVGIHTLIWCETMTHLTRTIERSGLRECMYRVAFQMSEVDSQGLVDTAAASMIGMYRAILYNEEKVTREKFRPYAIPAKDWLYSVIQILAQRQTAPEL